MPSVSAGHLQGGGRSTDRTADGRARRQRRTRTPARERAARLPARDEQLLERLQKLRTILPLFAEELAAARRQAAALRVENLKLLETVRHLQRDRRIARRSEPH